MKYHGMTFLVIDCGFFADIDRIKTVDLADRVMRVSQALLTDASMHPDAKVSFTSHRIRPRISLLDAELRQYQYTTTMLSNYPRLDEHISKFLADTRFNVEDESRQSSDTPISHVPILVGVSRESYYVLRSESLNPTSRLYGFCVTSFQPLIVSAITSKAIPKDLTQPKLYKLLVSSKNALAGGVATCNLSNQVRKLSRDSVDDFHVNESEEDADRKEPDDPQKYLPARLLQSLEMPPLTDFSGQQNLKPIESTIKIIQLLHTSFHRELHFVIDALYGYTFTSMAKEPTERFHRLRVESAKPLTHETMRLFGVSKAYETRVVLPNLAFIRFSSNDDLELCFKNMSSFFDNPSTVKDLFHTFRLLAPPKKVKWWPTQPTHLLIRDISKSHFPCKYYTQDDERRIVEFFKSNVFSDCNVDKTVSCMFLRKTRVEYTIERKGAGMNSFRESLGVFTDSNACEILIQFSDSMFLREAFTVLVHVGRGVSVFGNSTTILPITDIQAKAYCSHRCLVPNDAKLLEFSKQMDLSSLLRKETRGQVATETCLAPELKKVDLPGKQVVQRVSNITNTVDNDEYIAPSSISGRHDSDAPPFRDGHMEANAGANYEADHLVGQSCPGAYSSNSAVGNFRRGYSEQSTRPGSAQLAPEEYNPDVGLASSSSTSKLKPYVKNTYQDGYTQNGHRNPDYQKSFQNRYLDNTYQPLTLGCVKLSGLPSSVHPKDIAGFVRSYNASDYLAWARYSIFTQSSGPVLRSPHSHSRYFLLTCNSKDDARRLQPLINGQRFHTTTVRADITEDPDDLTEVRRSLRYNIPPDISIPVYAVYIRHLTYSNTTAVDLSARLSAQFKIARALKCEIRAAQGFVTLYYPKREIAEHAQKALDNQLFDRKVLEARIFYIQPL